MTTREERIKAENVRLSDFSLAPCHKCGSAARWSRPMGNRLLSNQPPFYGHLHFRVSCSNFVGGTGKCGIMGRSYETPTLAAMDWNTRATVKLSTVCSVPEVMELISVSSDVLKYLQMQPENLLLKKYLAAALAKLKGPQT